VAATVIELDISQPWTPEPSTGRRAPFLGAAFLTLVVTVILTGPALTAGRPFAFAWRAHTLPGQFWATARSVFTIDVDRSADPGITTLIARDPGRGAPQWTARLTGPLAAHYTTENHLLLTDFPPTFEQGLRSTFMDTRNGLPVRAYPTSSIPLAYVADEVIVLIDRDPEDREVAEPRRTEETGLDRAHLVEARDVRTGAVRWTRRLARGTMWHLPGVMPGSEGIVGLPPGENWMLTYTAEGLVRTWDLNNGDALGTALVGPLSRQSYVLALPGTLLVRIKTPAEASLAAYDPRAMLRRWRYMPRELFATPSGCGTLICLHTDRSTWGLDVRTGRLTWRLERPRLRPSPPGVPALVPAFGEQLVLFDPETGRRRSGDETWRVADAAPYNTQVVLARPGSGGSAVIGLLDLVANTVRRLGTVTPFPLASQCVSPGNAVVCEDGEGLLRVWHPR